MKKYPKYLSWEQFKKELLSDPKVKKAYEDLEPEYQLACQIIEARIKKRMSQEELAKRVGTGQAVISRLEGMEAKPTLSLIKRVARALKTEIKIAVR